MNINYNLLLKELFAVLFIAIVVYVVNLSIFMMLPKSGVEENKQHNVSATQRNYDYKTSFYHKTDSFKTKKSVVQKQNYALLSKVKLNALYNLDEDRAWIVIEEKGNSKTHILSLHEKYKNYVLKEVHKGYALFEMQGKAYKLQMKEDKLKYKVKE